MATVILNQLVGPVLHKIALHLAQEIPKAGLSKDPYYKKFHHKRVTLVVDAAASRNLRDEEVDSFRARLSCHGLSLDVLRTDGTNNGGENGASTGPRDLTAIARSVGANSDRDLVAVVGWIDESDRRGFATTVAETCTARKRRDVLLIVLPTFEDDSRRDRATEATLSGSTFGDAVDVRLIRVQESLGRMLDRAVTNRLIDPIAADSPRKRSKSISSVATRAIRRRQKNPDGALQKSDALGEDASTKSAAEGDIALANVAI